MKQNITTTYYECDFCHQHTEEGWDTDWFHYHPPDFRAEFDLCRHCYNYLKPLAQCAWIGEFLEMLQDADRAK